MKRILATVITAAYLLTGCAVQTTVETTTQATTEATTVEVTETTTIETTTAETTKVEETTAKTTSEATSEETTNESLEIVIDEEGSYTTCDDVSLYIYTYGKLPNNFITKKDAKKLGWEGGSLEPYAPGMCIGGDYFGNYEGLLPTKDGREYHECDIDTLGEKSRGAKRIIYSNDGLIYYTEDHYESFMLLYGEE